MKNLVASYLLSMIVGAVLVVGLLALLVREWRRQRRRQPPPAQQSKLDATAGIKVIRVGPPDEHE